MSKKKNIISSIVFGFFFFILAFLALGFIWVSLTWRSITFDEIIFHLMAPIDGTESGVIIGFILRVPLIALILTLILVFVSRLFLKKSKQSYISINIISICIVGIAICFLAIKLDRQYGIRNYFNSLHGESSFMDQYYVDPSTVEITPPEQERNLIYIYLESMEMTFADPSVGGAFLSNVIPELTDLALNEGECFNGEDGNLNGGIVLSGASWTMAGIMAQSSGAPIITGINNKMASVSDSFYPYMTAIGDVLEDAGYRNYFMCGSDAVFGGRAQFFTDHGNFEIFDYYTALETGRIPSDYKEWWGFEDEKLFEYAKEQLLMLASSGLPFNFTMLTADTHFEDGYICRLCEDSFDEQYSNVYACSSRQLSEFISWIKEQDFYENTTIVLSGDHLTMDADYCNDVQDYDRRTYVNILNSAIDYDNSNGRYFSTFDMFPTTLAALGFEIEGNRLGLGANLYSDEPTLTEQLSASEINSQMMMCSDFYDSHFGSNNPFNGNILRSVGLVSVYNYFDGDTYYVAVEGLENADEVPANVCAYIVDEDEQVISQADMVLGTDKIYRFSADGIDLDSGYTLKIIVTDGEGSEISLYQDLISEENLLLPVEYQDVEFEFEINGDNTARIVYPLLVPSGTVPGWIYVWDDNDPTLIRKFVLSHLRVEGEDGVESVFLSNDNIDISGLDPSKVNFSIIFFHDDDGVVYSNRHLHSLN